MNDPEHIYLNPNSNTSYGDVLHVDGAAYIKTEYSTGTRTHYLSSQVGTPICDDGSCCNQPIQATPSSECSVDIKYDWLLDDGVTYETRYTTIQPYATRDVYDTVHEIVDGPTIHTGPETPVMSDTTFYRFNNKHIHPGGRFSSGSISYIFDDNRNVTKLLMINGFYNQTYHNTSSGPYNNYSSYHDLWFADTYYDSVYNQNYNVIFGSNGDIHQIRSVPGQWTNQPVARQYYYNQAQIDNVEVLSGADVHPTSVLSINKTITSGDPDTAQVSASIRIPSQYMCVSPVSANTSHVDQADKVCLNPNDNVIPGTPIMFQGRCYTKSGNTGTMTHLLTSVDTSDLVISADSIGCEVDITYNLLTSQDTYTQVQDTLQIPTGSTGGSVQFDAGVSPVVTGGEPLLLQGIMSQGVRTVITLVVDSTNTVTGVRSRNKWGVYDDYLVPGGSVIYSPKMNLNFYEYYSGNNTGVRTGWTDDEIVDFRIMTNFNTLWASFVTNTNPWIKDVKVTRTDTDADIVSIQTNPAGDSVNVVATVSVPINSCNI